MMEPHHGCQVVLATTAMLWILIYWLVRWLLGG